MPYVDTCYGVRLDVIADLIDTFENETGECLAKLTSNEAKIALRVALHRNKR